MPISKDEENAWRECGASDDEIRAIADADGHAGYFHVPGRAEADQDMLDHLYQVRVVNVRNHLRGLGFDGAYGEALTKRQLVVTHRPVHVGAGRNVVGLSWDLSMGDLRWTWVDSMDCSCGTMAEHVANMSAERTVDASSRIDRSEGPYGAGYRDALESIRLALEGAGITQPVLDAAVLVAVDAYENNADRVDELFEVASEIVDSFPGFDADEEMNGGDVVERLGELYPRLKDAVNAYRGDPMDSLVEAPESDTSSSPRP